MYVNLRLVLYSRRCRACFGTPSQSVCLLRANQDALVAMQRCCACARSCIWMRLMRVYHRRARCALPRCPSELKPRWRLPRGSEIWLPMSVLLAQGCVRRIATVCCVCNTTCSAAGRSAGAVITMPPYVGLTWLWCYKHSQDGCQSCLSLPLHLPLHSQAASWYWLPLPLCSKSTHPLAGRARTAAQRLRVASSACTVPAQLCARHERRGHGLDAVVSRTGGLR